MSIFQQNISLMVHGFILAIIVGMFYVIWKTTRAYGGIIGKSLRIFGYGMLFISVGVIEKMLLNFGVLPDTSNINLIQDIFTLLGLVLLAWGFQKLAAASRV